MSMRFYVANAAEPVALGSSYNGAWNDTTSPFLGHLREDKTGTAATKAKAETSGSLNYDVLLGRWVSGPMLRSGELGGTVSWVLGVLESSTAADQRFHVHIYVSQGDSTLVRGTLLDGAANVGGTEWPTTAAGATEGAVTLAPVDCLVSDRLVVEIGYRSINSSPTSYTGTLHYGGTGATDLTAASTSVTTQPGWVEFSNADDVFRPPASTYPLEQYAPFDNGPGADMTEGMWRNIFRNIREDGVIATQDYPAISTELKVSADSTGMNVKVAAGEVWIQGHWGETLTTRVLPIETADGTNPRIDLVVARANFVDNKIEMDVKKGTAAGSPVAPTTSHNTSMWETPLAEVRVEAAVVTIAADKVTDKRVRTGFAAFTRWTPTLYYEGNTMGSMAENLVNLGTGNNIQTGWPAGASGRFIKYGTMVQVRYDFRYGNINTFSSGSGRIFTKLPPGLTHSSYGLSRLPCHLWTQQNNNVDTDWAGTGLCIDGNRIYPWFNLSSTSAQCSWYQSIGASGWNTVPSLSGVGGGFPDGGSLVISGILEVKE